jgi:uncharacterized protein (TIRG00374 family)
MVPLTALLVILLLTQASISDIIMALSSVNIFYIVASFLLFVILYVGRVLRFAFMLGSRKYAEVFSIVCTHSMANNVMPFRTGELAFVYLAKTRMGTPTGVGAAVIAIARLYDLLAICLMFIAALFLARDSSGYFTQFIPAIIFCSALLALLIVAVVWFNRPLAALTARLFSIGPMKRLALFQSKIEQICVYCSTLWPGKSVAWIFSLTVLMWAVQALNFYLLTISMGLGLGFWTAIAGMLLAIILVSLPVQGVGNFGSFELAWAAIFVALGAPVAAAVSSGFAVHVVVLAFTTILWIYGMLAERLVPGNNKAPA